MGANAGLHADKAGWHIGQPVLKLAARELRFKDDRSTPVEANQVEIVLPMSMPITGGRSVLLEIALIFVKPFKSAKQAKAASLTKVIPGEAGGAVLCLERFAIARAIC